MGWASIGHKGRFGTRSERDCSFSGIAVASAKSCLFLLLRICEDSSVRIQQKLVRAHRRG